MSENEWLPSSRDTLPSDIRRRAEQSHNESNFREMRQRSAIEGAQLAALSIRLLKILQRLDPALAQMAARDAVKQLSPYIAANEFANLREVFDALTQLANHATIEPK